MILPTRQENSTPLVHASKPLAHTFKQQDKADGKVLVVEDEESLSEILEFNLHRQGFSVLTAADGLEACRIIGREKPDLILLDIMLPLLNGWEICRMVRSHEDHQISQTPIIMLSALGTESDKLKGYDLGANIYLPKPYSIKEVTLQSRQLMEQRKTQVQLSEQLASIHKWFELQDQWQQALFHELRNQLTVISGMADHMCENDALSDEHSNLFSEQISTSSHYLGSLAENYLLVRQVESNSDRLQAEAIHLPDLFDELMRVFGTLVQQKSCTLDVECDVNKLIHLHPVGLKIIISNLLENALKYTLLDGHIQLSAQIRESQLEIHVCDDGPGIPFEDRDNIFEKFYRGQNQRERTGGSGLGLYMARTLARAMGGEIELVEQRDNFMCCFRLKFSGQ